MITLHAFSNLQKLIRGIKMITTQFSGNAEDDAAFSVYRISHIATHCQDVFPHHPVGLGRTGGI